MSIIHFKKPINLKNFQMNSDNLYDKRRIILPLIISILGILYGSYLGRGESSIYLKVSEIYSTLYFNNKLNFIADLANILVYPSIIFVVQFIFGLSVIGIILSYFVPFAYGCVIGMISYYIYSTYSLKGLAFCVIIIFPYAVLSMLSIILNCRECVTMSQSITTSISRNRSYSNCEFKSYCKKCLMDYLICIVAVIIKAVSDYLFLDFFNF